MVADPVRTRAYERALRETIQPGSVVLDLGAGVGVFALLACQLGASKVYAIEVASVIQLAREAALAHGVEDRIEFIQALSTDVELPETVDLIVTDVRGMLPWHGSGVESVIDARERFLSPGGFLVPQQDRLWAAVVEAPEDYERCIGVWRRNPLGLDFLSAEAVAVNRPFRVHVSPEQLLSEPLSGAVLDYGRTADSDMSSEFEWSATRSGSADGIVAWFETTLADGIGFSTGPEETYTVYCQGFFPFQEPVSVELGDSLAVSLRFKTLGARSIWRWKTRIDSPGAGGCKARFDQSTFHGWSLATADLDKRSPDYVPMLKASRRLDALIVEAMNGKATVAEIAHRLLGDFPEEFPDESLAVERVGDVCERFSL